jgi:hypothetical protein
MVIMTNLEFEARCIISILYGYLINEINLGYDRYQGSGAGDFATPCLHVAKHKFPMNLDAISRMSMLMLIL